MLERASSVGRGSDRPVSPKAASRGGLSERRRRSRRRVRIAFFTLLLILLGAILYGLRQPEVRIRQVQTVGTTADLTSYAHEATRGWYLLGLIPRDSFFFVPERSIRRAILADHPEFAAISISYPSLTDIAIKVSERTAVARWCLDANCYVFDPNGFVFAPAVSTTQTLNSFSLHLPLAASSSNPIRTTLPNANLFPSVFDFARRISTFGSPVTKIVMRDGEVDNYLASGTRITYLLGDEQNAITALVSAKTGLNLSNGSLDYVDLRFDGKVYLKKKQ